MYTQIDCKVNAGVYATEADFPLSFHQYVHTSRSEEELKGLERTIMMINIDNKKWFYIIHKWKLKPQETTQSQSGWESNINLAAVIR